MSPETPVLRPLTSSLASALGVRSLLGVCPITDLDERDLMISFRSDSKEYIHILGLVGFLLWNQSRDPALLGDEPISTVLSSVRLRREKSRRKKRQTWNLEVTCDS